MPRAALDREATANQLRTLPHAGESYASEYVFRVEPLPIVRHADLGTIGRRAYNHLNCCGLSVLPHVSQALLHESIDSHVG